MGSNPTLSVLLWEVCVLEVNYKMLMRSKKKSIWIGKSLSDYYKEKMLYYDKISDYFSYSSSKITEKTHTLDIDLGIMMGCVGMRRLTRFKKVSLWVGKSYSITYKMLEKSEKTSPYDNYEWVSDTNYRKGFYMRKSNNPQSIRYYY